MRSLASIQRIVQLDPILDADQIEKATILGWELVVKKGEFNVGDLCVYCEVDSILPAQPEFEFLRDRKFRIKTIKLKRQVSQGIAFPLSILPNKKWREGDDVTDTIGVIKYDPQAELERKNTERLNSIDRNRFRKFFRKFSWFQRLTANRLPFPAFIQKTDEDRIQLFPHICEQERDTLFDITEKLDGQSATYFLIKNRGLSRFWKPKIFGVCSRNFHLIKPDNSTYWRIARDQRIYAKLNALSLTLDADLCLQGEIIGESIQQNKLKITGIDFYVFNVIKFGGIRVDTELSTKYCKIVGLKYVPVLVWQTHLKNSISEMVEFAKGKSVINQDVLREGIVVRNHQKGISFKVINTDFLLKYSE